MMIGFRFLTIHGAAHFFSHIDVDNRNNVDNRNILCYNVDTVIIPRCRAGCNGRKACHKGYSKVERWLLPREAGRATARVPTTPLHCPRPYNDGDSRERVERLLRSPERAIEGALLRSSTGIASDRYIWCFLFKTRCDRTTASVLARSANDACASTDFVSQAERKAPISY